MKNAVPILFAVVLISGFSSCNDTTVISGSGQPFLFDQHFYPTEIGTFWNYRVDTTGQSGPTVRDVSRITARIRGSIVLDSLQYTVQENETISGANTTFDTLYIRKDGEGIHLSSPSLRQGFGGPLSGFIGSFPKEFLILPANLESTSSWNIINFEFNQIPIFPIYFRVNASYLGKETVQTDFKTYKECARIRIDIDARFPNPQNPTDFLNPLIIKENASFWLARPLGLVVGDGSSLVFTLLSGQIPLSLTKRRVHQEVMGLEIVQPHDPCNGRM